MLQQKHGVHKAIVGWDKNCESWVCRGRFNIRMPGNGLEYVLPAMQSPDRKHQNNQCDALASEGGELTRKHQASLCVRSMHSTRPWTQSRCTKRQGDHKARGSGLTYSSPKDTRHRLPRLACSSVCGHAVWTPKGRSPQEREPSRHPSWRPMAA